MRKGDLRDCLYQKNRGKENNMDEKTENVLTCGDCEFFGTYNEGDTRGRCLYGRNKKYLNSPTLNKSQVACDRFASREKKVGDKFKPGML